jgi:formylglycine-generating enzyme required for sulfatase activity
VISFVKNTFVTLVSIISFILCSEIPNQMILVEGGYLVQEDSTPYDQNLEDALVGIMLDDFFLGKYQVTVGEFKEFIDATEYVTAAKQFGAAYVFDGRDWVQRTGICWQNVGFAQTYRHPVVCVCWWDIVEYCNWRSLKEGLQPCYSIVEDSIVCDFNATGYRMPTREEWEFAVRDAAETIPDVDDFPSYAPVGSSPPNELGLHDMGSRIYEWCWDSASGNPCIVGHFWSDFHRPTNQHPDSETQDAVQQVDENADTSPPQAGISVHCGFRLARTADTGTLGV